MDSYSGSHLVVFGAYALFLFLAVGVVLVLWIFMPFSVFGLKGQIRQLAAEQRRTNELLERLVRSAPSNRAPAPPDTASGGVGGVKEQGSPSDKDRSGAGVPDNTDFTF